MPTPHRLPAPRGFRLRATIRSHGWSDLPPFRTDRRGTFLEIRLGPTTAMVTQSGRDTLARLDPPLRGAARREALDTVGSCLRFGLDLAGFWRLCRGDPELAWAARSGAGRFLRAPTAFADAAMTLATTNCSWALTRRIVGALVEHWGENGAFPAAELRRKASLGYRAPYLAQLARGRDLEPLRADPRPTDALRRELLELPGFGPYAAENLLRSFGRFEHFALDSWVTRVWREKFPRRRATESAIARRLARYGPWRGLAFWLLVTAHWYDRGVVWREKF
jgi:N-glycosylase/DNA lyase